MISSSDHSRIERFVALFLIVCPWLFALTQIQAAKNVFLALGVALGFYSIVLRRIPIGIHFAMDVFVGFFLMIAPYFYQYRQRISNFQALLHFAIGLGIWGLIMFTHAEETAREVVVERTERPPRLRAREADSKKSA